ncbi:hypothetical protein [Bradyrhizobium neotropicale]|uniref:hypothetical protein n=1 Tax=Bradyrhizobium neotropicale TaxID=1497615 RepID=UPI001FEDAC3B|nr:hypothetical protein [Bradyrhizobium neotropicale]
MSGQSAANFSSLVWGLPVLMLVRLPETAGNRANEKYRRWLKLAEKAGYSQLLLYGWIAYCIDSVNRFRQTTHGEVKHRVVRSSSLESWENRAWIPFPVGIYWRQPPPVVFLPLRVSRMRKPEAPLLHSRSGLVTAAPIPARAI